MTVQAEAQPTFPPLLTGQAVSGTADPFATALGQAALGCDAGLVVHNIDEHTLRAAFVFAPEEPLEPAMAALIACGVGFQNALGALAPPEVSVHLGWEGAILVNGAGCGSFRVGASTTDPRAQPDWLVVGLEVPIWPPAGTDPGHDPTQTALYEEGCVDVDPVQLLESWARHTLLWISRLEEDGRAALHKEWRGLAQNMGEAVDFELAGRHYAGTFMGVDENFGMLLRSGEETSLVPLSAVLEQGS